MTENITVADTTTGAPIAANGTVFSNEGLTYTVTTGPQTHDFTLTP